MYPIIRFTESFYIPTYFLVISLGYAIGIYWVAKRADQLKISRNRALDICMILMVGGFIGARLFHVFYELPEHYKKFPEDIFKFWQGGFVFYGGVIGAILPIWLFLKSKKESLLDWLNLFAPVVPLVYAIGRFATLLSGSGYGAPTDLPWGITYPPGTEAPSGVVLHPTPIYSMGWELMSMGFIIWLEKNSKNLIFKKPASLFYVFMIFHGIGRATLEQFRNDFRGELILGLTVSTWISGAIVLVAATSLIKLRAR